MKQPAVYILATERNGTLYVGVTSNLVQRIWQHRHDFVEGYTQKYSVHQLVYYELHDEIDVAIKREKLIKRWNRQWKLKLIEEMNPQWKDLYDSIARVTK
jgi:putative endonuclease